MVIYTVCAKSLQVGDPADGIKRIKLEQFKLIWINRALVLLEPGISLYSHRTPSWYSWLSALLKKERLWIYQTLFLGLVYTSIGLLTALFIQQLIDRYLPNLEKEKIILTSLFLTLLFLIRAGAGYLRYSTVQFIPMTVHADGSSWHSKGAVVFKPTVWMVSCVVHQCKRWVLIDRRTGPEENHDRKRKKHHYQNNETLINRLDLLDMHR